MPDHGLVLISMAVLFVQGIMMLRQRQRSEDLCLKIASLESQLEDARRSLMSLEWDLSTRPCGHGDCPYYDEDDDDDHDNS